MNGNINMRGIKTLFHSCLLLLGGLSLAISITIICAQPIYRLYLYFQDLASPVGLSQDQLMDDFSRMMSYLTNPSIESLDFQYFSASAGGLKHFAEVKTLMLMNFAFSLVMTFLLGLINYRGSALHLINYVHAANWIKWFPLVLLGLISVAFDRVFLIFHQLFFRNDLWLFDPHQDPIINVLPSQLFLIYFVTAILIFEIIIFVYQILVKTFLKSYNPRKRSKRK